jgi:hypothetical protein
MTSATDYSKFAVIDCSSGKITEGEEAVPLFMREGGEEIQDRREKELETFLKCLETYPLNSVILKEKTIIFHDGGKKKKIAEWFSNRTTKNALMDFLLDPANHKVNGKIWSNGFLGSRWADTELNGRKVRLAFYTRKSDPKMFASFRFPEIEGKDYAIIVMVNYFS